MSPRRILFASDYSAASRPAFAKARDLARELRMELVVMHVVPPIVVADNAMYMAAVDWSAVEEARTESARVELERLARAARKARIRVSAVLARGYPADEIVRTAKARKAGLIVMGTHGRTGISRLVMGSVASRVVSGAPCPVMTVRAKQRGR